VAKPAPAPGPTVVVESPTLLSQPAAPPAPPAPRTETMRRTSYILAGAGVLAGAAALGIYLANRDTYADWQAANEGLKTQNPGTVAYQTQAMETNELASSLKTANTAILGLSILGGALVAGGVTLFFFDRAERSRTGELSLGGGPGAASVGWSMRW